MKDKHKYVTVEESRYQIRRFSPEVGSYLLGKIIGAMNMLVIERIKALGEVTQTASTQETSPRQQLDEDAVRRLLLDSFSGLSFDDRAMLQRKTMEACSRMEGEEGDMPMPLTNGRGYLIDDLVTIMRLEMETLVFNFQDFFAAGGLSALTKTTAPPA